MEIKKTLAIAVLYMTCFVTCSEENTPPPKPTNPYGVGNGQVTFYSKSDLGEGNITISIDGEDKGIITEFHPDGVTCGSGNANVILSAGKHSLYARGQSGGSWSGNFDVIEGKCTPNEINK